MVRQRLPGGRGPRQGPDAIVDTQNEYVFRRGLTASTDGFSVSVSELTGTIASGVAVANTLRIYPLSSLGGNIRVVKAQIGINVVSAGGFARANIYRFDETPVPTFVSVPGSNATFSTAATGLITYTFPSALSLVADSLYFVAFVSDNATASYTIASGGGNTRTRRCYTATLASGAAFPGSYAVGSMTANTNANWYQVTYLSNAAAKVY